MKKKIGLLVAAIMVLNTVSSVTYGWQNPLNLYEDTHPSSNDESAMERDNVMSEYYSNSLTVQDSTDYVPATVPSYGSESESKQVEVPQRRNDYLRESSRKVYSTGQPGWLSDPSFYSRKCNQSIRKSYCFE